MQRTLKAHHHAHIPLRMSEGDLKNAAQLFLRFLEDVPDEEKRRIHFKSQYHRGSAVGYSDVREVKKGTQGKKDPKEYFHWAPELKRHGDYLEFVWRHRNTAAVKDFLQAAEVLHSKSAEMTWKLFEDLPVELRDHVFDERGGLVNGHLRFLCYAPSQDAFRAKPHYDKGQGAIALAESCPGLRIGCCDQHPLTHVGHKDGHAIFMPGQLLWEQSGETIMPAWHDVEHAEGAQQVSDRCARWAIVFFINDRHGYYPEWDDVHKPLPVHGSIAA